MERRVTGNSLGFDPQCARSDQVDGRLSESATRARVMDLGAALLIADDVARAIRTQMLELGQDDGVGNADAATEFVTTADFP